MSLLHLFAYVYGGLVDFVVVARPDEINAAVLTKRSPLRIDYHLIYSLQKLHLIFLMMQQKKNIKLLHCSGSRKSPECRFDGCAQSRPR